MSGGEATRVYKPKKVEFFKKLTDLFDSYPRILLFTADNVGSTQLQEIRKSLRPQGEVMLMGKNTMIRKALRMHAEHNKNAEALLPAIKGNVGMIFTKREVSDVKKLIDTNRKPAPARAGSVAPIDVTIPAQLTALDPTKTAFFQQLAIQTKITKGTIEIVKDVPIITAGNKVGSTEASLCQMLNITPFSYGLISMSFFETSTGELFPATVLSISEADLLQSFRKAVQNISCISLAANYPTIASVPNGLVHAYKNMLSIAVETNYTFKQAEKVKEYLKNPTAFAAAAAPTPTAAAAGPAAKGGKKKEEEKKEEEEKKPEEEEEEEMGMDSLFG